ncbi:hypothetical protein C7M84_008676 [Penaeus vannamei]|uniref:Uncharacterized protein n=1 Tax=Penaeus vannamei TaxID=6689 RepID=A0A423T8Y8_PENVA|nr:hypothetical protein C7M84_008676 [Penaeus vannamei]
MAVRPAPALAAGTRTLETGRSYSSSEGKRLTLKVLRNWVEDHQPSEEENVRVPRLRIFPRNGHSGRKDQDVEQQQPPQLLQQRQPSQNDEPRQRRLSRGHSRRRKRDKEEQKETQPLATSPFSNNLVEL